MTTASLKFPAVIPFAQLLGLELLVFADGQAHIACDVRTELQNSAGKLHGGAVMSLLDVTMAHAARSPSNGGEPGGMCVTIEMKTSFMRPNTGRVVAQGRVMHRTKSMVFCEASVFDESGALTAHATGTFKQMPVG